MSKPSKEAELAEFKDRLATAQGHRAAEQMELARGEYVQALAFAEQHFGADSEQVDEVCLELALFYCAVKEPESELAMLERRVRIRKAEAGIPQIIDALNDVAECHKLQDRPDDAETTYREALDLCDETIETHHAPLRMTFLYFGMFLNDRERHDEAIPILERGLTVCKLPQEVPTLTAARIAMHLGEALLQAKRPAEAQVLIDAATPVVTHRGQPNSTIFGKILYYLGNYHQREDRFDEAARAYVDLFTSYRFKVWGRANATLQLNVRNVQENGRLQPVSAFPDGTPNAFRIVDPRQFILSATFDL